jgi:heme exporter protein A
MVRLVRQKRHPHHEGERFGKVCEHELPGEGVACFVQIPFPQPVERICPFGFIQLFDHLLPFASLVGYVAAMQGSGQLPQAELVFDNVACWRGGRILFANVSFALGRGDALIVTGPNGVGKSSLLRLAAGLLEVVKGRVERVGSVALADEHPGLDLALPLKRALSFWAGIDGCEAGEGLDAVGLAHLCDVPVRMLSTGQRRRVTLARTVASGADVWLLDEPGNGLDAASLGMLEALIAGHRASGGIAVVASHQGISLPGAQELSLSGFSSSRQASALAGTNAGHRV